jgi:hypothetical protein
MAGSLTDRIPTIASALVRSGIVAAFVRLRTCPYLRGEQADSEDFEYLHDWVREGIPNSDVMTQKTQQLLYILE